MKFSSKRFLICLAFLASFFQTLNAQTATTLSGQYGCILNRNYAGFSTLSGSVAGSGITGTNFMLYFDFTAKTAQVSVVGVHNWGTSNVQTASLAGPYGTLSISTGPLTNSFLVSVTQYSQLQPTNGGVNTYLLMSTNGGNNLLVQSGTGPEDGQPSTGVCNKI
jgi:hypothetical protein